MVSNKNWNTVVVVTINIENFLPLWANFPQKFKIVRDEIWYLD